MVTLIKIEEGKLVGHVIAGSEYLLRRVLDQQGVYFEDFICVCTFDGLPPIVTKRNLGGGYFLLR